MKKLLSSSFIDFYMEERKAHINLEVPQDVKDHFYRVFHLYKMSYKDAKMQGYIESLVHALEADLNHAYHPI